MQRRRQWAAGGGARRRATRTSSQNNLHGHCAAISCRAVGSDAGGACAHQLLIFREVNVCVFVLDVQERITALVGLNARTLRVAPALLLLGHPKQRSGCSQVSPPAQWLLCCWRDRSIQTGPGPEFTAEAKRKARALQTFGAGWQQCTSMLCVTASKLSVYCVAKGNAN